MRTMRFYRDRKDQYGRLECLRVKLWEGGSDALAGLWRSMQRSRPNRRQADELMAVRGFYPKDRFPARRRRGVLVLG